MSSRLLGSLAVDIGRQLLQTTGISQNTCSELSNVQVVECNFGVYECCHPDFIEAVEDGDNISTCAYYNNEYKDPHHLHWPLVLAAIVGALMAFGIGSNDSANSWGSSVGSGTIPVGIAVLVGGAMEWLGAVSLGYGVSKKIRKGVAKPDDVDCWACGYCHSEMSVYMVAMLAALFAAAVFLLLATFTSMPVSTTHAIVGGVVGATIAGVGGKCLVWDWPKGLSGIIISWVVSPIGSGIIGSIAYIILSFGILQRKDPRKMAYILNPLLYFVTCFSVIMLILLKTGPTKHMDYWKMALIGMGAGVAVAIVGSGLVMPCFVSRNLPSLQKEISLKTQKEVEMGQRQNEEGGPSAPRSGPISQGIVEAIQREQAALGQDLQKREEQLAQEAKQQSPEIRDAIYTFRPLLVFLAALESFAHGANDTANATSAVTGVWHTWKNGLEDCSVGNTPVWLMAIAGGFVFLGVTIFGYRVIKTIGVNLVEIDAMRGYCIEFASTLTVVIATFLEVPVSTTHCQVGAVIFVGAIADGPRNVSWGLFGKIVMTWILTLPFAGVIAAIFTLIFRASVTN